MKNRKYYDAFLLAISLILCSTYSTCIHIRGWQNIKVFQDKRIAGADWESQTTQNINRCLRLCWLYRACGGVSYRPHNGLCMLHRDWASVTTAQYVPANNTVVVDMREAAVDKTKAYGCDTRPCSDRELCMPVTSVTKYKCLKITSPECGEQAPSVPNSISTSSSNDIAIRWYSCDDGFVQIGKDPRSLCDSTNHVWSQPDIECKNVDCGDPLLVSGAEALYKGTTFGSQVMYRCYDGMVSDDPFMTSECQANGQWSAIPDACKEVFCGDPKPVENGRVDVLSRPLDNAPPNVDISQFEISLGGRVEHTCNNGYIGSRDSFTSTCELDGEWSPEVDTGFFCTQVSCGSPPEIQYAFVSSNSSGDVVYECHEGYESITQKQMLMKCTENGTWSSDNLSCTPVDCGTPSYSQNTEVIYNGTLFGSNVTYKCTKQAVTFNNYTKTSQITCQSNGEWSPLDELLQCSIVPCASLPEMSNATSELTRQANNYAVTFKCHVGFRIICSRHGWMNSTSTGNCYASFREQVDFDTSVSRCTNLNSTLAMPKTQTENDAIAIFKPSRVWIGLEDLSHEGNFTWLDGKRLEGWSTWNRGEPNDGYGYGTEDCVEIGGTGWNDVPCSHPLPYICQARPDDVAICNDDNQWQFPQSICVEIDATLCGDPPTILGASVSFIVGSKVIYECTEGYSFVGSSDTIICTVEGLWYGKDEIECNEVTCDLPPQIEDAVASINTSGASFGSNVSYTCESEKILMTSDHVKLCTNDGWDDTHIQCADIDCGDAPVVDFSLRHIELTAVGEFVVHYECIHGYKMVDEDVTSLSCRNGNWNLEPVQCIIVDCGQPPEVVNSNIISKGNNIGDVAHYSCHKGYSLKANVSSLTRTCLGNGSWSSDKIECQIINCKKPPYLMNSNITYTNTDWNSTANYTCTEGYQTTETISFVIKTCGLDGTWTSMDTSEELECEKVDCGEPPLIAKSIRKFTGTVWDSTANYTCAEGYRTTQTSNFVIKTCSLDGAWTSNTAGEILECEIVDCGQPLLIAKSIRKFTDTVWDSTVNYTCAEGYRTTQTSNFVIKTCGLGGTWTNNTGEELECEIVDCGEPPLIARSRRRFTDTVYSSSVRYVCAIPYIFQGISSVYCNVSGLWQGIEQLECVAPACLQPPAINNTTLISYGQDHVGYYAEYACANGMKGNVNISRCEDTDKGEWSEVIMTCRLQCPDPPKFDFAHIISTNSDVGSLTTYLCDFGYVPSSAAKPQSLYCLENGQWSNDTVSCNWTECANLPEIKHSVVIKYYNIVSYFILNIVCLEGYSMHQVDVHNWNKPIAVDSINASCHHHSKEGWMLTKVLSTVICEPIDCGEPSVPPHAQVSYTNTSVNSSAIYSCVTPFFLTGSVLASECSLTGNWTKTNFSCETCNQKQPINNGTLVPRVKNGEEFADEANFTCDVSFVPLYPDRILRCEGRQDGEAPRWNFGFTETLCVRVYWDKDDMISSSAASSSFYFYPELIHVKTDICISAKFIDKKNPFFFGLHSGKELLFRVWYDTNELILRRRATKNGTKQMGTKKYKFILGHIYELCWYVMRSNQIESSKFLVDSKTIFSMSLDKSYSLDNFIKVSLQLDNIAFTVFNLTINYG